jgi:hypothetical protein
MHAVWQFRTFCMETGGDFGTAVALAEQRGLHRAPTELLKDLTGGRDIFAGTAFYTSLGDSPISPSLVIGPAKNGSCGIYAHGFEVDGLLDDLRRELKLHFVIETTEDGMRQQLFIPNGRNKLRSEAAEKGVVLILRSETPSPAVEGIIVNFIPPRLAQGLFGEG